MGNVPYGKFGISGDVRVMSTDPAVLNAGIENAITPSASDTAVTDVVAPPGDTTIVAVTATPDWSTE